MVVALRLVAATGGLLQLLVAALVLRRRPLGPFWLLAALLLVANGVAAASLAFAGAAPTAADAWFLAGDGPSGPLILGCGLLLLRRDLFGWDRAGAAVVAGTLLVAVTGAALTLANGGWDGLQPIMEWLHTAPAMVGLGVVAVAAARRMARAQTDAARGEAGLFGLAFLPAVGSNAFHYGEMLLNWSMEPPSTPNWVRLLAIPVLLAGSAWAVAVLARRRAGPRAWRTALLTVLLASGLLAYAGPAFVDAGYRDGAFAIYVIQTLAAYLLRPVALGLARPRKPLLWALHDVAWTAALVGLGKAAASILLGTPLLAASRLDAVGVAFGVALLPAAWLLPRRWARERDARRARRLADTGPDRMRADERLAAFLLHRARAGVAEPASKAQVQAATGITENNLAAAVRRLERSLDAAAPAGSFVRESVHGVRGRKRYALTPRGVAALEGSAPPGAGVADAQPTGLASGTPSSAPASTI